MSTMLAARLEKLSSLDPSILGDPAAAEEIHQTVLQTATTLSDLDPIAEVIEAELTPPVPPKR